MKHTSYYEKVKARLVLGVVAVSLLSGCGWLLRQAGPRPKADLQALGIRHVAVVAFHDPTGHQAGNRVAQVFLDQFREALGDLRLRGVLDRPGPRLASSWLRAQGTDGFITGSISGYQRQDAYRRVWVSMTVQLLATDGRILWSKRTQAAVALDDTEIEAAFQRAIQSAAREFVNDFLPPS